jgi:Fe-S oxidoreductase
MMEKTAEVRDPYIEKIENLGEEDIKTIINALKDKIGVAEASFVNSCVRCGLCADSCHYYLVSPQLENTPAYKLNLVLSIFKRYFTFLGKAAPVWTGAKNLDQAMVKEWIDVLFGRCSGCGRCAINCTSGINIPAMIRAARSALAAAGLVPPELQATVMTAVESGNNMAIPTEEWIDTLEWIQDELRGETGDPQAVIPIDQKGKKYLYTVNPREPKFFPLSLLAAAKVFHAADESWTFSSLYYDVTNYGLYSGDNNHAAIISGRLVKAMEELGAETLVLGECGHGYNSNRWAAPNWLQKEFPFPVVSVIKIAADYIREGRITLDPSLNPKRVTLHDPCNLVRLGGVIETQRYVLKKSVADFTEMVPNRQKNYCCGGGGGQLAMTRFAKRRIEAGRIKAEQIRRTGAGIVVAPCHNCIDQLSELNKEYKLGVEIKTVVEMVGNALVLPAKNDES